MQLSQNFTLERFVFSSTAERRGIDNTAPDDVVANLKVLANYLEQVQSSLGHEIHFNDVYRCNELNMIVGGSPTSDHVHGLAADFTCPSFGTPREVIHRIVEAGIPFDQLIYEGTWVHFGCGERMRGELETASFANGKPTYTLGVA